MTYEEFCQLIDLTVDVFKQIKNERPSVLPIRVPEHLKKLMTPDEILNVLVNCKALKATTWFFFFTSYEATQSGVSVSLYMEQALNEKFNTNYKEMDRTPFNPATARGS